MKINFQLLSDYDDFLKSGIFEIVFIHPSNLHLNIEKRRYPIIQINDSGVGIYEAMNLGIAQAHGEYLSVINIDDWCDINSLIQSINRNIDEQAIYGSTYLTKADGKKHFFQASENWNTIAEAKMPGSHQAQIIKEIYIFF